MIFEWSVLLEAVGLLSEAYLRDDDGVLLTHLFFSENRSSKPKFTRSETGKTSVLKF
jgi:hypothetical protein